MVWVLQNDFWPPPSGPYGTRPVFKPAVGLRQKLEPLSRGYELEGGRFDDDATANGCPVLSAAMGWLECSAEEFVPAGDHTIVIGAVLDGRLVREAEPLTSSYTGWNYSG